MPREKTKKETPKQKEEQKEEGNTEEEEIYGLGAIIQGVLAGDEAQSEVTKVGTSFEVVLVGQRIGRRELDSHLDFSEKGSEIWKG